MSSTNDDGNSDKGRHFFPVDESADDEAGFRLPRLIDSETEKDETIDAGTFAIVIESSGRELVSGGGAEVPEDHSAADEAGFRLPRPRALDDEADEIKVEVLIVEARNEEDFTPEQEEEDDVVIITAEREPKGFDDDFVIVGANDSEEEEVDCSAVKARGPCYGEFGSYYFDSTAGKCEYFVYSGCGGNSNRYNSFTYVPLLRQV